MEDFTRKIVDHPEYYKRLFWLNTAESDYPEKLYCPCFCLIAANEGEGVRSFSHRSIAA